MGGSACKGKKGKVREGIGMALKDMKGGGEGVG